MLVSQSVRMIPMLGLLALGAACSDGTGPAGPTGPQVLSLSVGAKDPSASIASTADAAAATETITLGSHTLVIQRVELVLKELELKRVAGSGECPPSGAMPAQGSAENGGKRGNGEGEKECAEFELGPLYVDLPLGSAPKRILSVVVDTGSFHELEFKIHKPDHDPDDDAFLQAHPDLVRVSIRVRGTFDGLPFGFVTDLTATEEAELVPPLVVTTKTGTDLTLMVDISKWFVEATGTQLIDPITAGAGQPNDRLVRANIRQSFRAFNDAGQDDKRGR